MRKRPAPMSIEMLRQRAPCALEQALDCARARGSETRGAVFVCFDLHTPPGPLLAVEALMGRGKSADDAVIEVRARMADDEAKGVFPCAAALVEPARFVAFLERVVLPSDVSAELLESVRAFVQAPLSSGSFPAVLVAGTSIQIDVLRVSVDRRAN